MNATIIDTHIEKVGLKMNWTFTDITTNITINGDFFTDEFSMEGYFQISRVTAELDLKSSKIYIQHVDYDQQQEREINKFLNGWVTVKDETIPPLKTAAQTLIHSIANIIYRYLPLKMLIFP